MRRGLREAAGKAKPPATLTWLPLPTTLCIPCLRTSWLVDIVNQPDKSPSIPLLWLWLIGIVQLLSVSHHVAARPRGTRRCFGTVGCKR